MYIDILKIITLHLYFLYVYIDILKITTLYLYFLYVYIDILKITITFAFIEGYEEYGDQIIEGSSVNALVFLFSW